MHRMPLALLTAVALVAALAACSSGGSGALPTIVPVPDSSASAAPSPTATPTPTPTPTVAAPAIPPAQLPAVDPAGFMTNQGGPGVEFDSPSGNIHCGIYDYGTDAYYGCSIDDYHYVDPDPQGKQATCEEQIHYGGGFIASLNGPGVVGVLCRGGAMFASEIGPVNVLPYNTSVTWHDTVCESYEDHMGCRSLVNGHGFTLARGEYTLF